MANPTEIANLALSLLGQNPVTNLLNPQSTLEQLVALQYPLIRDAVLEETEWSFAVRRYTLSTPAATQPDWGFSYAYQVPNEVVRVTFVSDNTEEQLYNPNFLWTLENGLILCDAQKVYLRTVVRVEDSSKYSNLFIQALAARLAMELCIPLTENPQLQQTLVQLYATKMQAASTMDNMQGKSQRIRTGRLTGARGGI